MRKSIRLAPGVRLNVSKRGLGVSAGIGGVRYSVHSSGRRTVSARTGVPGIYYQKSVGSGSRSSRPRARAQGTYSPPPLERSRPAAKPGVFAPKAEKELFKAFQARNAADVMAVGDDEPSFRCAAYTLAGFLTLADDKNASMAERLLSQVWALGSDPATDPFISKYVDWYLDLPIVEGVTASLRPSRDAVGLLLAELYQDQGRLRDAIETVEHLEPTTYAALSLAELYSLDGDHDKVIELTEGVTNEDDASALLLVFRGVAFREQGFHDAAHEAFKEALRSRSRAPTIRHHALYERARNYKAQGKKAMARKDLERILAEDSDYQGVRDQLAELAQ